MPRRASTHRSAARFIARTLEGSAVAPAPGFVEPSIPVLRSAPPNGEGWVHEIKYDGYRLQAHFDGGPRLFTRRGHDWTGRVPNVAAALERLPAHSIVLDGELVAIGEDGKPSFEALHRRLGSKHPSQLAYYAFDLLYLDGFDIRRAALVERKRVLRQLLEEAGSRTILYLEHLTDPGAVVFEHAAKMGLEGIVSKRAGQPYRSGRNAGWIKVKTPAWRAANKGRAESFR